ncbi:S-layer homology domain-containing protein [Saccharibacillus sp. O23]|uniref:S-layer homology domain-containing protein n=1 Tax=Saccharibacillus sp. O23 TaxID=2009338 RepID=UPI0015C6151E|nr:S-layer homology domain-containing protein [Saccharibacillus sp. O23]
MAGGSEGVVWKLVPYADPSTQTDGDPNTNVSNGTAPEFTAVPVVGLTGLGYVKDVTYRNGALYVTDAEKDKVYKFQDGILSEVEGMYDDPTAIAIDTEGNLYIADTGHNQIQKVNAATGKPEVIAGNGNAAPQGTNGQIATQVSLNHPEGVAVSDAGTVYIADTGANRVVRMTEAYTYEQQKDANGEVWNLIKDAEGLDHMRDDLLRNYLLTTDISKNELETYLHTQDRTSWKPVGEDDAGFRGKFDGGGHAIDGLKVDGQAEGSRYAGLFGTINRATVKNVSLTNVQISATGKAGGLTGDAYGSRIERVWVEGSVSGTGYSGGLVGELENTGVSQSYFKGEVQGSQWVGGLLGHVFASDEAADNTITDNYVWARIAPALSSNDFNSASTSRYTGGFVGGATYYVSGSAGSSSSTNPTIFKNNYSSIDPTFGTSDSSELHADVTQGVTGPFEGQSGDPLPPSFSNYWDNTYGIDGTSKLASELTNAEMKSPESFKDWDFQNIWTTETKDLARLGYPVFKAHPVEEPTTPPVDPTNPPTGPTNPPVEPTNPPTVPSNPSTPSTGGTPEATPSTPSGPQTSTVTVDVQNSSAIDGTVVSLLTLTRTKGTDGVTKDALQLTPAKATEIIDLLKKSGSKTAAIMLPDPKDEVSEWNVSVPKNASKMLTDEGVELVIMNPNVRIAVPTSSLTDLTDDLYFRLIPVKSTATSAEIQQRALNNPEIVKTANGGDITVLGRPMTIETNLQSRPVTLTLPLPKGSTFTAAQQKKLGVYIEHSDGTKQLVRGTVVTREDGTPGLEINVNKFSTFTIVNVSNWGGTLNAKPYILGYKDGSFKPEQDIVRSELAAIVSRITGVTEGTASFSDVKNGSWASTVVGPAAASGIMTGYSDGTFKPNASITRGELAAALAKLLPQSGLSASATAAGFGDLSGHWAASAAAELQAAGVVTGYADGSFKPEQAVTRAEAVTMINRLIGLDASMTVPGASEWSDVASGYWAHDAIRAASMAR